MKHVSTSAKLADKWYFGFTAVLRMGEDTEMLQEQRNDPSAYDYEDFVSNLIGVGFAAFLRSDDAEGKSIIESLEFYLRDLGFIDDYTTAPNFAKVGQTHAEDTGDQNKSYTPKYAPDAANRTSKSDILVLGILKKHSQTTPTEK